MCFTSRTRLFLPFYLINNLKWSQKSIFISGISTAKQKLIGSKKTSTFDHLWKSKQQNKITENIKSESDFNNFPTTCGYSLTFLNSWHTTVLIAATATVTVLPPSNHFTYNTNWQYITSDTTGMRAQKWYWCHHLFRSTRAAAEYL